jgi:hypothetical protein
MQSAHQRARHVAGRAPSRAPSASPPRPPRAQPCEIARDGREMRGDCRSAPRAPPCVDEARRAPRPSSPPAMVIRGHPRSSEVIRGHWRSSEVIRGHQRSSEEVIRSQLMAIRGHQSSSPVFATCHAPVFIAAGNQRPSPLAIRGNQRQSGAITCRSASHVSIAACRRHVRSPCTDRRRREKAQTRASNISFHAAHPRRIPSWSIRRTTCLAKCSTRLSFSAALCGPRA